ncbi:MAG TPA: hypothetical protein VHN16_13125 [Streptosporangiaceae bacterium]|nr:hypothetical protein [Streptosporangiaceae bacterium]
MPPAPATPAGRERLLTGHAVIEAVVFDLDGVLIDLTPAAVAALA